MSDITTIQGKKVLIRFEGKRCIHARECVTNRPDVFVPNGGEDWIHPDAAGPDEIAALAYGCPSGAIQFERTDGGPNEPVERAWIVPNEWWATETIWNRKGSMSGARRASTIVCGSIPALHG